MTISIIIPTRNEASHIGEMIEYLRALPSHQFSVEIIVADGASDDDTPQRAHETGARVLLCERNRGAQQNDAARVAGGEVLWFLHADARPHRDSLRCLQTAARNPGICGGNFRLRFAMMNSDAFAHAASTPAMRLIETIARLQRRRGVYYGDSGIWVQRSVFDLLGGFRNWPLFEDYDFARRLETFALRNGLRTNDSSLPILVSPRRLQRAPLRVLAHWAWLQGLFSVGVSPERLARKYFRA